MGFELTSVRCIVVLVICYFGCVTNAQIYHSSNDGQSSIETVDVILFMFFGLGLGILVMQALSIFGEKIPFSCVIFILGIVFSTINKNSGELGDSIAQWVNIDAEMVLYIFLPPLIFGEAMNQNWFHIKGAFVQSVLLAGPGVIIGAMLMGVATKFILPYNWNWNMVMIFGSILAATDTVAVLSLLKSANASPKLTVLIVGESLLNDGSAIVLFTIFFNALNGEHYTAASIISFGFSAIIGSVVVGVLFGLVCVRWLRSANRPLKETDITIQIAITFTCSYLSFFAAQYSGVMSGPLACCFAGLVLSKMAPPIILNHETMHNVWGMVEWFLNTLIFLLAGLITGHRVLEKTRPMDWLYLFILYAVLVVVRAVTIAVLYPALSNIGHKCTIPECVFMTWGGLRGAVGMMLGLIVEKGCPSDLSDESSLLFFYVGGIVALTFFVNATTAKAFLSYLGLMGSDSPEKQLVMTQIKKKLGRKISKLIDQMATELKLSPADVEEVRNSCTLLNDENNIEDDLSVFNQRSITALIRASDASDIAAVNPLTKGTRRGSRTHMARNSSSSNLDDEEDEDKERRGSSPRRSHLSVDSDVVNNTLANSGNEPSDGDSSLYSRKSQNNKLRTRSRSHTLTGRARNNSVASMRVQHLSSMLNMSHRGRNPALMLDLLYYVRGVFLEIVRVRYWFHIDGGKLPRLSHSAQFLLYSIEVGLDEVQHEVGCRDWFCVQNDLDSNVWLVDVLSTIESYLPNCCVAHSSGFIAHMESTNEKRAVYMLTSFIEAHEHAQRKIHEFIGIDDDDEDEDDEDTPEEGQESGRGRNVPEVLKTPEEIRVINESRIVVAKARNRLKAMTPGTVTAIRSKQAARLVLAKEAEMVKTMVHEGLISPVHAEEFLEEIGNDTANIEKKRDQMYKELASTRSQHRQSERESLYRSSVIS